MNGHIAFPGNAPWGAVNQHEMRRLAREAGGIPHHVRLWMVAQANANRIGHAEFPEGALREFLGTVDKGTGEMRLASKSVVSNAIARAKTEGFLSSESNARCLVLPSVQFQKEGRGSGSCAVHGIRKASLVSVA